MKTELAEKLLELHEAGYEIVITDYYVTGVVNSIHKREDNDEVVYSDDVYSDRELTTVSTNDVKVYERIEDWQTLTHYGVKR